MMRLLSRGMNHVRDAWNKIFSIFLNRDKREQMRVLGAVMDVYGFYDMQEEQEDAAAAVTVFINALSMKEHFHLENVYRCCDYGWEACKKKSRSWNIDYMFSCILRIQQEEERRAVLIAACMSADGYLRQKCLKELVYYRNSLPYLLLRLNDWVKEIRLDAFQLSMQRFHQAELEELLWSLPVVDKLRMSYRKETEDFENVSEALLEHLIECARNINFNELDLLDQTARNAFYRLILRNNIYDKEKLQELLERTRGNFESRMVIHALMKYYEMSEQDFRHYLEHKSGVIRRYAIEKWSAKHGIWDGAEQYLMDRSKSVRSNVQYLIRNNTEMDLVSYYRDQLSKKSFKIAIDGLGETGNKGTAAFLLPYLDDPSWVVRRKALRAVGNLLKEGGEEYYFQFLGSENIALVKTAYQQCCKWNVIPDSKMLLDMYEQSGEEQRKCYYLQLLGKCPFWDCVTIYLNLYGRVGGKQQAILSDRFKTRPMYQTVAAEKGNQIRKALEENRGYLPEGLYQGILFDLEHLIR